MPPTATCTILPQPNETQNSPTTTAKTQGGLTSTRERRNHTYKITTSTEPRPLHAAAAIVNNDKDTKPSLLD